MTTIRVDVNAGLAQDKLDSLVGQLAKPRSLFQAIAQLLESETEANFEAQGRPDWVPLQASTIKNRLSRGKAKREGRSDFVGPRSVLKVLQDRGILAASISSDYGDDFAVVGANTPYAAIQQFGGTIERPSHSTKVRLRTDAKGNLLRQHNNDNLAVFAKDSHKRARESWHEVDAFNIKIPARPYLPFKGSADSGTLQPETERSVLELVVKMIGESFN